MTTATEGAAQAGFPGAACSPKERAKTKASPGHAVAMPAAAPATKARRAKAAGRAPRAQAASPRYRTTHAALAKAIRKTFPRAKPVLQWGMAGWLIPRPKGAPVPPRAGTMDPTRIFVGLAEGKTGLTVHLWYPGDDDLLGKHRGALRAAGLKAGRGCIVWTRKGAYPVDAVAELLRAARDHDRST
jgi:hypothetical protein